MRQQRFLAPEQFSPFPSYEERERWSTIPAETAAQWIQAALPYLDYSWPALRVHTYAAYQREGDLISYLELFWERRSALGLLVTAELLEGNGRFLDDIVNGITCICEETTWVVPHHNVHIKQHPHESMPAPSDTDIELASGETAGLLALAYYLMKDKLDAISERIGLRIQQEIRTRVIEPYMSKDDYWWMGFRDAPHLNNWNPWCNGNMLICFLFLEKDEPLRSRGIEKVIRSLEAFIQKYPEDGCCDEGPMYWGSSGGGLYRCLDLLYRASDGEINRFSEPLIQNIGRYIYRVHIHDHYYANFADGDAILNLRGSAFGYGKRIGDEHLIRLGASVRAPEPQVFNWFSLYVVLSDLFEEKEKAAYRTGAPLVKDAWMAYKQVMTTREQEGQADGLYLAVKGGDNDESHNHNDVGNFIVYVDGLPLLIDLGTETYRAQTFSPQRYDLWYLQSQYHNLPTVNGHLQLAGAQYRAESVKYDLTGMETSLSMDLAAAYPEQAGIVSWQRACRLTRGTQAQVHITDTFALRESLDELFYSLITPCEPKLNLDGEIHITYAPGHVAKLNYDEDHLQCRIETIELVDERLQQNWGPTVYRIVLSEKFSVAHGTRNFIVSKLH